MPYICPITKQEPKVPAETVHGDVYEFAEIAKFILTGAPAIEPTYGLPLDLLNVKSAFDTYGLPIHSLRVDPKKIPPHNKLTLAEKIEIVSLSLQLKKKTKTNLNIVGLEKIEGLTPLFHILTAEDISSFSSGATERNEILWDAAATGNSDLLESILMDMMSESVQLSTRESRILLHIAAFHGHEDCVRTLLTYSNLDPNVANADKTTALHLAASNNHHLVISILLSHDRINPNVKNKNNETPLFVAIAKKNLYAFKTLLQDPRVNRNKNQTNIYGESIVSLLDKIDSIKQIREEELALQSALLASQSIASDLKKSDQIDLDIPEPVLELPTNGGIQVEDHSAIRMRISPKYMSLKKMTFYRQRNEDEQEIQKLKSPPQTAIHQIRLNELKNTEVGIGFPDEAPTFFNTPIIRLSFYKATSKLSIRQEDKCFFIMAGRVENALIPPLSHESKTRCIIVLTADEYSALMPNRHLKSLYDFLVIDSCIHDMRLSTITIRRRATLHFAFQAGLSRIIMMDDNIQTFYIESSLNSESAPDLIFDNIEAEQRLCDEPIVSTATLTNRDSYIQAEQLGCKVFMMDIAALKHKLPDEADWLALLPERETAWGQDYFMQIVAYQLFKNSTLEKQGYAIIDPQKIQIKRSTHFQNTCKTPGIRAGELSQPSEAFNMLLAKPETQALVERSIQLFNQLVTQEIKDHEKREEFKIRFNFAESRARTLGCKISAYQAPQHEFNTGFRKNLLDFLNQVTSSEHSTCSLQLHRHQIAALSFLHERLSSKTPITRLNFNMATASGKTLIQAIVAFQGFLASNEENIVVICPTIMLVQQTREAFIRYAHALLTTEEQEIICPRILAICTNEISSDALEYNASLISQKHIHIMCADSFEKLIKKSSDIISKFGSILYDESHLVEKNNHIETLKRLRETQDILSLCFSATPKPLGIEQDTFFYGKGQGINDGVLAPLMVDDSLPDDLSTDKLVMLLKTHQHPNGLTLKNHKGIIYVKSIKEANALFETLKAELEDTPIFEVHSQNPDKNICDKFKKSASGIAIAVKMLIEGFDDSRVDWMILNKEITEPERVQIVGRLLRKNPLSHNKIGLAMLSKTNNTEGKPEKTLFPVGDTPPNYANAQDTLRILSRKRSAASLMLLYNPESIVLASSTTQDTTEETPRPIVQQHKRNR